MPGSNGVAILDDRGRYLKGMPGGPGRPLASRNKLREDFLTDMHAAWLEHGPEVINRLIAERPEIFLMAMLKITQVHRVELGRPSSSTGRAARKKLCSGLRSARGQQRGKCWRISWPEWRTWSALDLNSRKYNRGAVDRKAEPRPLARNALPALRPANRVGATASSAHRRHDHSLPSATLLSRQLPRRSRHSPEGLRATRGCFSLRIAGLPVVVGQMPPLPCQGRASQEGDRRGRFFLGLIQLFGPAEAPSWGQVPAQQGRLASINSCSLQSPIALTHTRGQRQLLQTECANSLRLAL